MATLPSNFPYGCTDEALQHSIADLASSMAQVRGNPAAVAEIQSLIDMGTNEAQRRGLALLSDTVYGLRVAAEHSAKSASKIAFTFMGIGFATVLLGLCSAYYAFAANRLASESAKRAAELQDKELPLLQAINDVLKIQGTDTKEFGSKQTTLLEKLIDETEEQQREEALRAARMEAVAAKNATPRQAEAPRKTPKATTAPSPSAKKKAEEKVTAKKTTAKKTPAKKTDTKKK